MLYPIKFYPRFFEKIWGGNKLKTILNKPIKVDKIGESWELSSVSDEVSIVSNGFLADNDLNELIEVYMGDLVGEEIYKKYGDEFPLLIKFIDANDILSVQVHPDDNTARERHNAYGKTEMWYIIDAEPDSSIYLGFNRKINKSEFVSYLNNGKLEEILNKIPVNKGDVFFIPSGRIHAIGKGILLAEIQQTSDITYRIFDWNRKDANGNPRELHIKEALDVINYDDVVENPKIDYKKEKNKAVELVSCNYFTTQFYNIDKAIELEYIQIDSFKILIFIEGEGNIFYNENFYPYSKGDVYLIPAILEKIEINPILNTIFLETFIK